MIWDRISGWFYNTRTITVKTSTFATFQTDKCLLEIFKLYALCLLYVRLFLQDFFVFCPGSLGQLIMERGRLPEDLSLHYHSQVLTALEYLAKKKVAHLDIKGMYFQKHDLINVKAINVINGSKKTNLVP